MYMIVDTTQKRSKKMQETINYILDHNYGDTLTNTSLAKLLGYNIEDEKEKMKFKSMMARVKNFLIDYGYILKSIPHLGYYILKPKQIAGHCYRTYIRRTTSLLEKSDKIINHTAKSELSADRLQEHNEIKELNEELTEKIWNTIQESGYYRRKDYYNNLED